MPQPRISKDQSGVPEGLVRWEFDCSLTLTDHVTGERYKERRRVRVIEAPDIVGAAYHQWKNDQHKILRHKSKAPDKIIRLFQYYLANHVITMKTKKQYLVEKKFLERFKAFIGKDIPVNDFRRKHIEAYKTWRKSNCARGPASASTINKDIAVLSSFFNWCIIHEHYTSNNPASMIKLRENNEREINPTPDQVWEIIQRSREFENLEMPVMLAIFAGLRKGEILSLTWADVDLSSGVIHIRKSISKSKKSRTVPISPFLNQYLAPLQRAHQEQVVILTHDSLKNRWERCRDALSFTLPDIEHLTFHDLRHIFAQGLRNAGVSLDDISSFLGHSTTVITQSRYSQAGGYNGKEKVARLDDYLGTDPSRFDSQSSSVDTPQ